MDKKIYIAGCGGMLGEAFYKTFSKDYNLRCSDIDLNEKWLSYLDFRDFNTFLKLYRLSLRCFFTPGHVPGHVLQSLHLQ